jgi:hypothetical protein
MKTISQAITVTLGMGMFVMLLASRATAGCGDPNTLQGPFVLAQEAPLASLLSRAAEAEKSAARGSAGASIVGMWNFQLVSEGNTAHNPSIRVARSSILDTIRYTATEPRSSIPAGMHQRPRISV